MASLKVKVPIYLQTEISMLVLGKKAKDMAMELMNGLMELIIKDILRIILQKDKEHITMAMIKSTQASVIIPKSMAMGWRRMKKQLTQDNS